MVAELIAPSQLTVEDHPQWGVSLVVESVGVRSMHPLSSEAILQLIERLSQAMQWELANDA